MFAWDDTSTYVRQPPYFQGMPRQPEPLKDITDARVLALLGDSVTTDHISPAGAIKRDSPAGKYLMEHGVEPRDFNSYGSRRGNHEVMIRGTFANIRLRNQLVPDVTGGFTRHLPDGEQMSIFDASTRYLADGVPLVVIAGKEYGSGSSRDWAAKGTLLLGVKAVLAESFERIHRSNLIGMGVLPLQFAPGADGADVGADGRGGVLHHRIGGGSGRSEASSRLVHAGAAIHRRRDARGRLRRLLGDRANRHARRGGLLPARRHPAVRPAQPARLTGVPAREMPLFASPRPRN